MLTLKSIEKHIVHTLAAATYVALILAAASVQAQTEQLTSIGVETPALAPGQESRPLSFERIVVKLQRGHIIGRNYVGIGCISSDGDIVYEGGRSLLDADFFADAFREELRVAGYNVVGDPNALFQDRGADEAELIVGGLITNVQARICYNPNSLIRGFSKANGEATMEVEWQVLDRISRRTVYQGTTVGTTKLKKALPNGQNEVMVMAFAAAARELLANQEFVSLATRQLSGSAIMTAAPEGATTVPLVALSSEDFQDNITMTRARVATVISQGHGSGFFVSDNYLLTNEHVVGGARIVVVKLVTGREIVGEVVATNSARDVALIRTEGAGFGGLPLRTNEPRVGDSIFVIGSPMDEELENTVSAGIVSAFRSVNDLRFIQSDVSVLPGNSGGPMFDDQGNVIAITVIGMYGQGSGLNLFIPIGEALNALNIQVSNE